MPVRRYRHPSRFPALVVPVTPGPYGGHIDTEGRVLVATKRTRGWRPDDLLRSLDGELVRLPTDSGEGPALGDHRAVHGLGSRAHTTTCAVVDRPYLDIDEYRSIMRNDIVAAESFGAVPAGAVEDWLAEFIGFHVGAAAAYKVGDILELRNSELRARWTLVGGSRPR